MAQENHQAMAAALSRLIVPIPRRYHVRAAFLSGSAARGEAGPESDVDLLAEYERGTTLFDIAGLKLELKETLGRGVDLTSPQTLKPRLREHVPREQVRLL